MLGIHLIHVSKSGTDKLAAKSIFISHIDTEIVCNPRPSDMEWQPVYHAPLLCDDKLEIRKNG